ncbi:hypothetical protein EJ07DRAFT_158098 [Lizonia empirigonia]|nr:hypothetical protein EJ07DRAFT_158098 [Lizonia empirigonia]
MALPCTDAFRFLDLPREIRNEIYRILLCSFEPRPTTVTPPLDPDQDPDFMNKIAILQHTIDTNILRASKQIHREAYETMVKTNRFVRVSTPSGLPMRFLLNHLRVPVIAEDKEVVGQFQGYTLSVSLICPKDLGRQFQDTLISREPCHLMMLSRDMGVFCKILADGDLHIHNFGMNVAVKIAVAPGMETSPPPYKDWMSDFFSEKTQEVLLQPFRAHLRGFKKIKVCGHVSRAIAKAVEEEIAQDAASDPEEVITNFQTQKDEGQGLYRSNRRDDACLKWQDTITEIERLHQSSSWEPLTKKGGVSFITRLAELYFLMQLNTAHVLIDGMTKGQLFADMMADDALTMASRCARKNHWTPGFRWRPTDVHMAKLFYRWALLYRLKGDPKDIEPAVVSISKARNLLPNDAGVARERKAILVWRDEMRSGI